MKIITLSLIKPHGCAVLALLYLIAHPWAKVLGAPVAVSVGLNFTGTASSTRFRANPAGAVNSTYFVEFNLNSFNVYSKADGSFLESTSWNGFWGQAGYTVPSGSGRNNARVVYDPTVQRWFVAEGIAIVNSSATTYQLLLAVSATTDPTGAWNSVAISNILGATSLPGETELGLDAQGVYLSSGVVSLTSGIVGSTLASLPKADLLNIPPVTTNLTWLGYVDGLTNGYGLQPAICFDAGARGDLLGVGSTGVDPKTGNPVTNNTLVTLAVTNAGGPGNATLGASQTLVVPDYTEPIAFALQPDGSANLEDADAEFTSHVYRVADVLYAAHALQYGPRIAVRWYRVSASNHTLLESGTITDPTMDFYFPSIAANTNGTVVLAFNGSGSNTFVSCFALIGQTVNGVTTFGNPLQLQAGNASYQNPGSSGNHWGNYSTTCVDPSDNNVFWTINTYAAGPTTWSTQITQLLTSPRPSLSITAPGTNVVLSWPVTTVPFQLQSAVTLSGAGSWSPVTQGVSTDGIMNWAQVTAIPGCAFFRLAQSQ